MLHLNDVTYSDRLVAFTGEVSKSDHLSHCCRVVDLPGIAAGIGAMADIYRVLTVVKNGCFS